IRSGAGGIEEINKAKNSESKTTAYFILANLVRQIKENVQKSSLSFKDKVTLFVRAKGKIKEYKAAHSLLERASNAFKTKILGEHTEYGIADALSKINFNKTGKAL